MISIGAFCAGLLGVLAGPWSGGAPEPAAAHPNSFSLSEIHIREDSIQVQLRCQVLSLGEVIEPLDRDLDGMLEPGELRAHEEAVVEYVSEHYRLIPSLGPSGSEGAGKAEALRPKGSVVTEAPRALDPLNEVSEWVDIVLDYGVEDLGSFRALEVQVDLFQTTSPLHRDSAAVVWNGIELGAWQFAEGSEVHRFEPTEEMLARNTAPLWRYLVVGAKRALLGAFDAGLLVLLFVAAARWRSRASALMSVGLFLGLASAGALLAPHVELLPQHVRFLGLTVPLALAYVGLDDLLHGRGRTRILETSIFGLVLGGREATRLAPEVAREASSLEPLAGFAAGFSGSLLLAAVVLSILLRDSREAPGAAGGAQETPRAYSWRGLRRLIDSGAIVYGLWLFWIAYRG